jgi:hypothetical protein
MGIQYLNYYMRENCPDNIRQISLSALRGKKIVIDTSIYMYRFEGEGSLIDGMYQMIALFRHYEIIPVFVFDGVAPPEKMDLLKQRKFEKDNAEFKYNETNKRLQYCNRGDINKITTEMKLLQKQFIKLKTKNINKVKELMNICGVVYLDADGESDQLCAKLVLDGHVYACMSEDMDMFVYGCPRVLRYFSVVNCSVVLYDFNAVLKTLKITNTDFKKICVVSGTDYNINNTQETSLPKTVELYNTYKNKHKTTDSFYDWLIKNTDYIKDVNKLHHTLSMFDLSKINIDKYKHVKIANSRINEYELRQFLKDYDFIFV